MHKKKKVNIGFEFQAKKYPRYKDVKSLWRFDYKLEEKKRFEMGIRKPPQLMWNSTALSSDQVNNYL